MGSVKNRSAFAALRALSDVLEQGYTAVYDVDLKGYFDSIPHVRLLACVEKRIADGSVLKLIRMWLKTPVLEPPDDRHRPPRKVRARQGTPQGGVISPLLANLYLHWMDKRFHASTGPARLAGAYLIRYADEVVILARYMGTSITDWVTATVENWMGLVINRDKTHIITLKKEGASLDFLGYTFRYERDKFGRNKRFLNMVRECQLMCPRTGNNPRYHQYTKCVRADTKADRADKPATMWLVCLLQ